MRILEGTPDELKQFLEHETALAPAPTSAVVRVRGTKPNSPLLDEDDDEDEDEGHMAKEICLRALKRNPQLGENVKGLLKILQAAYPTKVSGAEIAKKLHLDKSQLTGVFGAFGRRCASTTGFKKKEPNFFDFGGDVGNYTYQLTPESLQAVEEYFERWAH